MISKGEFSSKAVGLLTGFSLAVTGAYYGSNQLLDYATKDTVSDNQKLVAPADSKSMRNNVEKQFKTSKKKQALF